jgi:hypothetical protein
MSDLRTALQAAIESGEIQPTKASKPKQQQKRKGSRSTGELTLRTLRWLVETRLAGVEAGVSWHRPESTAVGRELLAEINERLDAYEHERGGPRGPSSVDKSDR